MNSTARAIALAAVMAVSALVVVPATPAMAASCGGSAASCDNTSPQTTGCSADAVTKSTVCIKAGGSTLAKVELRYSPSCRTAWSRVTNLATTGVNVIEQVDRLSGGYANDTDFLSQNQSGYSPQLYVRGGSARASGLWDYDYSAFTPWIAL